MKAPKSYNMTLPEIIRSINTSVYYLRQEGEIANINEIIDEYTRILEVSGFSKEEVYAEYQKQFEY